MYARSSGNISTSYMHSNYFQCPRVGSNTWDKVFKNGPSKICERQSLKNLKGYGLLKQIISLNIFWRLSSINFTWPILEFFAPFVMLQEDWSITKWYQKNFRPVFCFIGGQQRKVFIITVFSKSKYYLRLERQVRCARGHHFGAKGIEIPWHWVFSQKVKSVFGSCRFLFISFQIFHPFSLLLFFHVCGF